MTYHITKDEDYGKYDVTIWKRVKRLRDFKPEEGVKYLVRNGVKKKPFDKWQIYKGVDGKLVATSFARMYMLF